jgi:adenine-specific DNA-methyltransferase
MTKKQKLELTWVGKENRPRLEPRILLEDPAKSYHAPHRLTDQDIYDNRLIFGDNLLALKALEQEFAGKVRCIFIDPPYNTGSAFEHYDDGVEHSLWLSLMRDRLELIRQLLSENGSLWITIDDNEAHYLKVLCDEIFGRANFVANVVWQKRYARDNNAAIGSAHDHIFVYAKSFEEFRRTRNRIELDFKTRRPYTNQNGDPKGPWQSISFTGAGFRSNMMYPIIGPDGREHRPPEGRHWGALEPEYMRLKAEVRIWFGQDGKGVPRVIRYLSEVEGLVPSTWWPHEEVGHNDEAKKDAYNLLGKEAAFETPKPERLLSRIIHIATDPGDLVLDSFAGSGTTGAVAHKMGRRWIMVELGEHCDTHIIPRLKKVIDGEDKGGITEAAEWHGGGGFRYIKLEPSLLETDQYGREVISKTYNAEMLAEALCKLEGFTYAPSDSVYWQHGASTERDFIYVTTQTLGQEQLAHLSDEVGPDRSLLVLCSAFRGNLGAFQNLTVKKIPNHVRSRCEWGHDDYSLNVENLPKAPPKIIKMENREATALGSSSKRQTDLFGPEGGQ